MLRICILLFLAPALGHAANIDEIAYLSNQTLKELSSKASALIMNPTLGVCGKRRELKITGRNSTERWTDIIQNLFTRERSAKNSVRVSAVGKSRSSVDSAVNRVLLDAGYHNEIPSETEETVKLFKLGLRENHNVFPIFSGQVRGANSDHAFSFLAMADEAHNELLILCLGEELCR